MTNLPRKGRKNVSASREVCLNLQPHPGGGVVAGGGLAADPGIDTGVEEARGEFAVEQKVIDAHAGILFPVLAEIIPEGVDRFVGKLRADGVGPTLREEPLVTVAGFGLEEGV